MDVAGVGGVTAAKEQLLLSRMIVFLGKMGTVPYSKLLALACFGRGSIWETILAISAVPDAYLDVHGVLSLDNGYM